MSLYPRSDESADHESSVDFDISGHNHCEFQVGFRVSEGTATTGTISIVVTPRGMTAADAITLSNSFNASDGSGVKEITVLADEVSLVPDNVDSGVKFTGYLDCFDYKE